MLKLFRSLGQMYHLLCLPDHDEKGISLMFVDPEWS